MPANRAAPVAGRGVSAAGLWRRRIHRKPLIRPIFIGAAAAVAIAWVRLRERVV
jgi:hypothetical protein